MIDRDAWLYVAKIGCSRGKGVRLRRPLQAEFAKGGGFQPELQRHAFGKAPEARGWQADILPQIRGIARTGAASLRLRRDKSGAEGCVR